MTTACEARLVRRSSTSEGGSDEAIQLSALVHQWIASRSLSSGARSRDPLARNDGLKTGCLKIESGACTRNATNRFGLFIVIARSGSDEAIQLSV
jgi:hypothetical protein